MSALEKLAVAYSNGSSGRAYDVIVVGGGHNGLVAAFYLAREGLDVALLERREILGGACVTEELIDGYRMSSCAAVAWQLEPKVVADLELHRHGFAYHRLDPVVVDLYPAREYLRIWLDEARTQEEVRRLNSDDAHHLPAWNAFWRRAAGLVNHFFLREPPSREELRAYARAIGEEDLLEKLLTVSLADICEEFFEDPRVAAAFTAVEDSGDPWVPGSALPEAHFHRNVFTDVRLAVVTGGMGTIGNAMASAAAEQGADIRTGAEVERILVDSGRVRGVRLQDGTELRTNTVVSNADPKRTLLSLLEPGAVPGDLQERVRALSTQAAYLKLHGVLSALPDISDYLGREPKPREVAHFKIAPTLDHSRRAYAHAQLGQPAAVPVIGSLVVPTVYDPSIAPDGRHIVSIWAPYAPPRLAEGTWDQLRQSVGEALIDYVTEFVPNFRSELLDWVLLTPEDQEKRIGLTDGNIRHLDMVADQFLDQRPLPGRGYATSLPGLYLCGAGTHPGGEVTGAPGHNAAQAVIRDRRPAAPTKAAG